MNDKSPRKLILHIGAHKTGSTAIQTFLLQKKQELLAKGWFFCERPGRPTNWGHMIRVQRESGGATFPLGPVILGKMLELMDSNLPNVIFSAEDLFFLDDANVKIFANEMQKRFTEINVIAYLRRQDEMAISHWTQGGRTVQSALVFGGLEGPLKNINRFMLHYLDYASRVEAWRDALPDAKLSVRIYDRSQLPNRDVIEDFVNISGLDVTNDGKGREVNSSIGSTTVRFVYLLREAGLQQRFIDKMMRARMIPITEDKILPSQSEVRAFMDRFVESNARLARLLGCDTAFSDDYSQYPEQSTNAPLDQDFTRETLLFLLADQVARLEAYEK